MTASEEFTETMTAQVAEANIALAELSDFSARWWLYSVSHRHFRLLVGDAHGQNNVVLAFEACDRIAGPVAWKQQRLHITFRRDGSEAEPLWLFTASDPVAGFIIEAKMFTWHRNCDLLSVDNTIHDFADEQETPMG